MYTNVTKPEIFEPVQINLIGRTITQGFKKDIVVTGVMKESLLNVALKTKETKEWV